MMRRFILVRHSDPTGVSGTGKVAEGVQWPDGVVAMQWCRSPNPLPMPYPSIDVLLRIHGHGGSTVISWIDEDFAAPQHRALDEPRNFGAVVRDRLGYRWVRTHSVDVGDHWINGTTRRTWSDLHVVEIISPGSPWSSSGRCVDVDVDEGVSQ